MSSNENLSQLYVFDLQSQADQIIVKDDVASSVSVYEERDQQRAQSNRTPQNQGNASEISNTYQNNSVSYSPASNTFINSVQFPQYNQQSNLHLSSDENNQEQLSTLKLFQ